MFSFTRKGLKFPSLNAGELKVNKFDYTGSLWVPLCPMNGAETKLTVEAGQRVEKYGILSKSSDTAVYSPCAGRIKFFSSVDTVNLKNVPCAVIQPDDRQPIEKAYASVLKPGREKILSLSKEFGVFDFFSGGPAEELLREVLDNNKKFFVTAIDDGPDLVSNGAVLLKYYREILSAAGWICALTGKNVEILTDNSFVKAKLKSYDPSIGVRTVGTNYPAAFQAKQYARREGGVLVDVLAVLALFYAYAFSRPLVSAFISVSKTEQSKPKVYEVPIGIKISELIKEYSENNREITVIGGVMNGKICGRDVVITPECCGITIMKKPEFHYSSCIHCGLCVKVCPTGVAPSFVYEAVTEGIGEKSVLYGAKKCIACGCCSYICPAKIPLAEIVMAAASGESEGMKHD